MANAKKLPSGNWRAKAYVGKDPVTGKKMYASFTEPTKKAAELKAAQYAAQQRDRNCPATMTVKDAMNRYIAAKAAVLSPSTIREYRGMQKRYYSQIENKKVSKLTSEDMQLFISGLTPLVSAKTVANAYALLTASVALFRPDAVFRVTLPTKQKKRRVSPSDEQIQSLFEAAKGDLKKCIALAAFGSMRRGEICALKHKDISGVIAHVHADMVQGDDGAFVYKDIPKTSESNRYITLPPEVISLVGDGLNDDFIIKNNPNTITKSFILLRDSLDLPEIRFHDLRHYYASIGAVLGIPDAYMSAFGGWRPGSGIMKQVYQNQIENASRSYAKTMSDHFSSLINQA